MREPTPWTLVELYLSMSSPEENLMPPLLVLWGLDCRLSFLPLVAIQSYGLLPLWGTVLSDLAEWSVKQWQDINSGLLFSLSITMAFTVELRRWTRSPWQICQPISILTPNTSISRRLSEERDLKLKRRLIWTRSAVRFLVRWKTRRNCLLSMWGSSLIAQRNHKKTLG